MNKVLLFVSSWKLSSVGMNQFRVEYPAQVFCSLEREVKYRKAGMKSIGALKLIGTEAIFFSIPWIQKIAWTAAKTTVTILAQVRQSQNALNDHKNS